MSLSLGSKRWEGAIAVGAPIDSAVYAMVVSSAGRSLNVFSFG